MKKLRALATTVLPSELRTWLRSQQRQYRLQLTRVGTVNFGDLLRISPISPVFGLDRGLGIERYYTELFIGAHSSDIHSRVLEIGDNRYTRMFGGERVTKSDVLHVVTGNKDATIVSDLTRGDIIPSGIYDCIILTFTLQMIYDFRMAVQQLHRILKPKGVLLVTSHGISKIGRREGVDPWGEYWRFTSQSLRRLFKECFRDNDVLIESYGNVLAAVAPLHGLAAAELPLDKLHYRDPDYEVLIAVRAVKAELPASKEN